MGKNSKISWTNHSWNPWQGCKKVSAGCQNCYMFRDKARYGQYPEEIIRSKPATFNKPMTWKDPAMVFVCSWSDFFIEEADEWRSDAWDIIRASPHLTFQLLTKRPEKIIDCLPFSWGKGYDNVWLGVTAENQEMFDKRLPLLLDIPAKVRFLSIEPMIGPIALHEWDLKDAIDWIIVGGESGHGGRTMDLDWARYIRDKCKEGNIPFFMKQMSGNTKAEREAIPEDLQIKEFPNG